MNITDRIRNYFTPKAKRKLKLHYDPIHTDHIDSQIWIDAEVVNNFTNPFIMFGISCMILLIMVYPAIAILSDPAGLPGVIGKLLAGICLQTGQCSLYTLLPAFAIANLILIDLVIYFMFIFFGQSHATDPKQDLDLEDLGRQLNERLENIRDQLDPGHNESAWALDAIYSLCNSDHNDPLQMICKIQKISGETMGYISPENLDCEPVAAEAVK